MYTATHRVLAVIVDTCLQRCRNSGSVRVDHRSLKCRQNENERQIVTVDFGPISELIIHVSVSLQLFYII